MALLDVLTHFGFDSNSRASMARHKDSRFDFEGLVNAGRLDEYQTWQRLPKFHDVDFVVSFVGGTGWRAHFWGVYRVGNVELIDFADLTRDVPWTWPENTPHYRYELERMPGFEPLVDRLVINWTGPWCQQLVDKEVLECPPIEGVTLPAWNPVYGEGRMISSLVMSRVRSNEARRKCLEIHGCKCYVCDMDFPARYSGLGEGFMHVHHLTAMQQQEGEYEVDPERDLRPVCPNCHAMLHWDAETPRTIEELKSLLTAGSIA